MAEAKYDSTQLEKFAAEKFMRAFKENGFSGLRTAVIDDIDAWKGITFRIAVTGNTGSGKSSLINALRDLNADSDISAPVGHGETTVEINIYEHPNNRNVIFCDLPGVGSVRFPKESYLEMINFSNYDVIIIVADKRFTANDIWLAREIALRNKKIFFVRTRIGNDMKNNAKSKKNKKPEGDILKSIREDCQKNLETVAHSNDIFLIDNHKRSMYDFPKLKFRLIHDTEGLLGEALAMTLRPLTKDILDEKHSFLKKSVWKIALLAALAPRIGNTDIKILQEEKARYKQQFGLESPTSTKSTDEEISRTDLDELAQNYSEDDEFEEITSCFPFIPPIYNQMKVYKSRKKWLQNTLQALYTAAERRHASDK